MTQRQLADLCGFTQQTVSRLENNEIIPRDTTKRLIAKHLGSTLDALFPWDDFDCTNALAVEARSA